MKRRLGKIAATFLVLMLVAATATRAQAPTFTVLHSFSGGDGAQPEAPLLLDDAGNLYGTARAGGSLACNLGPGFASGCGIAFKLDPSGNETVVYSFKGGSDGANPFTGLVRDAAGNLYGTTLDGGSSTACGINGCGTVFKLDPSGNETVLHSFTGVDGARPILGALIRDAAGNLYGTTQVGGSGPCGFASGGCGTVFKIDTSGNEIVLHSFLGSDGEFPAGGVVMDGAGNLYGTTNATVFKVDPVGNETVLHIFTGSPDGASPEAGLLRDAAGNLYGTTTFGGRLNLNCINGCGVVFKLDAAGNETILHSFTGPPIDGAYPVGAALTMDKAGNLYGTTESGGSFNFGTVFKLDPAGNETILHSFAFSDGAEPAAGLLMDASGNLYGTTLAGGSTNCSSSCGTVFKLAVTAPPAITSISPTSAIAGGPGFTLTVNGTNFVSGSTVSFNGNARATTFVSATQVTAVILASDIATAGSVNVTVTNRGGGTSNAVRFTVVTPQQATQTIINSVNVLFSQGVLNGGQDNSLVGELQHAIDLMNASKNAGAIGNLDSFISEVNDLLSSGVLSPSQAASLVSAAESVIAAI